MQSSSSSQLDGRWLIDSRSRIQRSLVDLHDILTSNPDLHSDAKNRFAVGQLVGAAFSLWRAAFLTDTERGWPTVLLEAKNFLETLIRDNAINYPQDRATRDWSVGYYLNNARHRLYEVLEKFPALKETGSGRKLLALKNISIAEMDSKVAWDTVFDALAESIESISASLRLPTAP